MQTYTTYIVASDDSLSVIAKRFETTVTSIKELNHLTTDTIYIGQILKIPTSPTTQEVTAPVVEPAPSPPPTVTTDTTQQLRPLKMKIS
ncbi:LysM peptidoglycan-binding domain-containing protein [Neobacillus drentensis]|uniref:LysM peptidoglycan-binding domain-containing protein n=1 Tax=Neobacillus drentensis TaxID=220684 RepID=UPI002FFD9CFE